MNRLLRDALNVVVSVVRRPISFIRTIYLFPWFSDGIQYATEFTNKSTSKSEAEVGRNDLLEYFNSYESGQGIWKWRQYFSAYNLHLSKFRGKKIKIVEIGLYSGGSIGMWREYFGPDCEIIGVDILEETKAYENDFVKIYIGDQEDREFWRRFKDEVGEIDILIDDGGHTSGQQKVTLEEMLPMVKNGGVYICEDIHSRNNRFTAMAIGLVTELNSMSRTREDLLESATTSYQKSIHSIHFYPYMLVIEKNEFDVSSFEAPKHGTEWLPPTGKWQPVV